ncbi:MAG: molybdenum cofactor biosynthesis protein MoaE [Gemmatimonadales bacterium]|nr:molybdenum cofactor biosynthesis protein MoaE [Gemmatimonadales bacterium]
MPYLTSAPIDASVLSRSVASAARGGLVSFEGRVRDHHASRRVERLEYTAYGPMAEAACAGIVGEAERRWPVAVALAHRIGELAVGDVAVAVIVAAAHRDPAFEACRYVIDQVKARVPIWKREYYADGSIGWVDPTAPAGMIASVDPSAGPAR